MKKLLIALTTVAAMSGSAFAADLGRPYTKAPAPMAPVYNWTGFYIFGGAGGSIWSANDFAQTTVGGVPLTTNQQTGGSGWFGTVGLGYDWQFSSSWVAGIFADGQFGSSRGTIQDLNTNIAGTIKEQDAWAAGVRLGYLVAPSVLSYVNGGYSGSHWSGTTLLGTATALPSGVHTNGFNANGWFVGGGVENNLNIFGITAPGWFMKTEYRSTFYNAKTVNELVDGTNALAANSIHFKPWTQSISTSLVYRFNWTGPALH